MNLILLAAVITLTSAAQLPSRNYIPQGQGQQPGYAQGPGGSQGGFGGNGQNGGFGGSGGNGNGNTRPQQDQEKNAAILKQDQGIDESGNYHFGYETENGIRAEEAGSTSDAQGGFSYKGDDGNTYTVTYTSGEGGFRPQGEHLPVAPPTPDAILEALQKNAEDEAKGIFDDGIYRPDENSGPGNANGGGGHFGNGNGNRPNGHGNRPNGNANRPNGNGNRPGQGGQPSFGGNGNHQNGFNSNSGYTY